VASSAGMQEGRLAVLPGLGGGSFGAPTALRTGDGWPSGVAIADLDRDDRPDLAVSLSGDSPRVLVFRQSVDHAFTLAAAMPVSSTPNAMALLDATGDGRLDLVVGHDDAFAVLPRLADGWFGAEDLYGVPRIDGSTTSMAVGPRDAAGRALVEFNGELFAPRSTAAPNHAVGARRSARLSDRMRMLPSATR